MKNIDLTGILCKLGKVWISHGLTRKEEGKGAGEQGKVEAGKVHSHCLLCVLRASAVKSLTVSEHSEEDRIK